jgi:hypothetical protein
MTILIGDAPTLNAAARLPSVWLRVYLSVKIFTGRRAPSGEKRKDATNDQPIRPGLSWKSWYAGALGV